MGIPKGGIAFFDSGIGGLTVLSECARHLKRYDFYYFGDNAHAPYGNLPSGKIRRLVLRVFRKFARLKVSVAVVACNTATAVCIDELREKFPFPIVGIEPAVLPAAAKGGEVFVLSTRATYESERFRDLCARAGERFPASVVRAYACDGLAGAIEKNLGEGRVDLPRFLPEGHPKSVVLGCTHYGYVKNQIADYYRCEVVDGNRGVALQLGRILRAKSPVDHRRPRKSKFSPKVGENPSKIPVEREEKKGRIFFLGGHKTHNFRIYEQMFG